MSSEQKSVNKAYRTETKYWLELLKEVDSIDKLQFDNLFAKSDELGRILFSILKTTRIQNQNK